MQERHVDDLLDAYALGALEPAELDEVERHLAGCARCQAYLEDARIVVSQLLLAAPSARPPAELRSRVLAAIAVEVSAPAAEADDTGDPAPLRTFTYDEPGTGFGRFIRSLFGTSRRDDADHLLRDLLADPACAIWTLPGTAEAPNASARLVGLPNRRDGVLLTSGLQRTQRDQEYQVWFLRSGQPMPNALFRVNRQGRAAAIVRAPHAIGEFDVLAVTPEPLGGSTGPTGPIVLAGSLARAAS